MKEKILLKILLILRRNKFEQICKMIACRKRACKRREEGSEVDAVRSRVFTFIDLKVTPSWGSQRRGSWVFV